MQHAPGDAHEHPHRRAVAVHETLLERPVAGGTGLSIVRMRDVVDRAAGELVGRASEQRGKRLVHAGEHSVRVDERHADVRPLECGSEQVLARAQRTLGQLALRDVLHLTDKTGDRPALADRREARQDPHRSAGPVHAAHLPRAGCRVELDLLRMADVGDVAPVQLLHAVAEHVGQRRIDPGEGSVEADERQADARELERAAEARLALAQLRLGRRALGARSRRRLGGGDHVGRRRPGRRDHPGQRVVERDAELPGDQHDGVEPVGGERAASDAILEHGHGPQRAARHDRQHRERAYVEHSHVWIAGEPIVATGVVHQQRLERPLGVPDGGHRDQSLVPGLAAAEQDLNLRRSRHRAEDLDQARRETIGFGLGAQRPGRFEHRAKVDRVGGDAHRRAPPRRGAVEGGPADPQERVLAFEHRHLRARAPDVVGAARFLEQRVPRPLQPVLEMEHGGALADQRPVPRSLKRFRGAQREVEGTCGGVEVARRPGPLGFHQIEQMREVAGCVRRAQREPVAAGVELGEQRRAVLGRGIACLARERERLQQLPERHRIARLDVRQQRHRGRGVPGEAPIVAEQCGAERAVDVEVRPRHRVGAQTGECDCSSNDGSVKPPGASVSPRNALNSCR